jgi:hypothetical protein
MTDAGSNCEPAVSGALYNVSAAASSRRDSFATYTSSLDAVSTLCVSLHFFSEQIGTSKLYAHSVYQNSPSHLPFVRSFILRQERLMNTNHTAKHHSNLMSCRRHHLIFIIAALPRTSSPYYLQSLKLSDSNPPFLHLPSPSRDASQTHSPSSHSSCASRRLKLRHQTL